MKTPTVTFEVFLRACADGDLAKGQEGLPHVDLRQTDRNGSTALMWAARFGHVEAVRALIRGSDLGQRDGDGWNALVWAARKGHVEAVKLLIPGSDLRQATHDGSTALMFAAHHDHADVVRALLPGSDVRQADNQGNTALMWAAGNGSVKVVRALIPGSDLSQKNLTGKTALERAVKGGHWACVDLLGTHDPECDRLAWPEAARPDDLPQWFARREKHAMGCAIASERTPKSEASLAKRHKRI